MFRYNSLLIYNPKQTGWNYYIQSSNILYDEFASLRYIKQPITAPTIITNWSEPISNTRCIINNVGIWWCDDSIVRLHTYRSCWLLSSRYLQMAQMGDTWGWSVETLLRNAYWLARSESSNCNSGTSRTLLKSTPRYEISLDTCRPGGIEMTWAVGRLIKLVIFVQLLADIVFMYLFSMCTLSQTSETQ